MNSRVKTGLESYLSEKGKSRSKPKTGLLANPASVLPDFTPAVDAILKKSNIILSALFGPQHGIFAHTQDNMITWNGFNHPILNIPVYSLYGDFRKPSEEMLSNIDELVIDLQDTGTRVYTFASTMFYCIEACAQSGKKIIVLDRPNPVNGEAIEGNVIDDGYYSFVGMLPVSMRHGLTMGELAVLYKKKNKIDCDLKVVKMKGWKREMCFDETGLPWVMPSPNMPATETAAVYPGTVLLEGTNISEGRGTTRPFEIIGTPFIDADKLKNLLESYKLSGVIFRAVHFQPGFNKWKDELCKGVQIHITDKRLFKPYLTGVAIIKAIAELCGKKFRWKKPPYEYEYKKFPIDIISGSEKLRKNIENGRKIDDMEEEWLESAEKYRRLKKETSLY